MHGKMSDWITTGERPALPLFVRSFAKSTSSGGRDDDADDDDDDADDDDEDDDPDEDKTDEELRLELKATRASLAKANGQSAKRRKALREKDAELVAERTRRAAKKPKADDDDGPDLDEIRAEAKREGESAGLIRAKKAEAKSALLAAGVNPARVAKAVGLVKLEDLDLDDDGLDGIDDEIDELRKTWPELFVTRRRRRESVVGEGDRDGKDTSSRRKPKTASELAAERVLGR